MTTEERLDFLKQHQPMKATMHIENDIVSKYEEIRNYFCENPDERCIPLFLNSFGEGDAHGVYQLVGDVMFAHPAEIVVKHLKSALQNPYASVRYWSAQIASQYADSSLTRELLHLLSDSNSDVRCAAVIALDDIADDDVIDRMRELLKKENDESIRLILVDILERHGTNPHTNQ